MTNTREMPRVCGVDGCRDGWVVASASGVQVVPRLELLLPDFDIIGIDMPVGLSDGEPRACDRAARKALPNRGSTVFPAPPRPLLHHTDYATANAESRRIFGRGISRQAFAIWPKVRELDEVARRAPGRFVEIHPECSFTEMTGIVPPSKHGDPGKKFRREALERVFGGVATSVRGAKPDDVLDAYAVLWSALRFSRGEHRVIGSDPDDTCGLPVRIVA